VRRPDLVVTIPDVGEFEYPDDATPEQIRASARELYARKVSNGILGGKDLQWPGDSTIQMNSLAPEPAPEPEQPPAPPELRPLEPKPRPQTVADLARRIGEPLEEPPGITPRMERPEAGTLTPAQVLSLPTQMPAPRLSTEQVAKVLPKGVLGVSP